MSHLINRGVVKIKVGRGGHECLILILNLKINKQTRSEASKNKVIIKRFNNPRK